MTAETRQRLRRRAPGLLAARTRTRAAVLPRPGDHKIFPIPLNNLFIAEFRGSQGDSASAFNTGVNLPTHGQFHHVVATYDNATRTLLFYYDTLATDLGSNVPPNMEWTSMDHPWTSLFVGFRPEWSRRFHGEISIAR